jgi:hypothetical protein
MGDDLRSVLEQIEEVLADLGTRADALKAVQVVISMHGVLRGGEDLALGNLRGMTQSWPT